MTKAKATPRSTFSPVDSWGTPEHDAYSNALTAGHLCTRHSFGNCTCGHWSDEKFAAYQRMTRSVR